MVLILGENHDVVTQDPLFGVSWGDVDGSIKYWAEDGCVCASWCNKRGEEQFKILLFDEVLERVVAMHDWIGKTPRGEQTMYASEINKMMNFVEGIIYKVLPKAQAQGPQMRGDAAPLIAVSLADDPRFLQKGFL